MLSNAMLAVAGSALLQGGTLSGPDDEPAIRCTTGAPSLKMRGVALARASTGLLIATSGTYDLGSPTAPGTNALAGATGVALLVTSGGVVVNASGNTWLPSVQGADAAGNYPTTTTLGGPVVPTASPANLALAPGSSVAF